MGCAKMLRIIDALTGVFASSAEAPGAHAPSVRRVPARSVAPPRTRAIRVEIPTCDASSVVDDEGMEREALELVAAVEEGELDQERHADDVAPELLDQPERRGHRAARGEQVIDGEYALPRLDRVLVDGERVAPVLELVLDLDGLARELTELPHGDETRAQLVGERPAEDEPARLDGDHDVHALLLIAAREHVDHVVERRTVLEKGGDVLEEDPLGWEVPDVTDLRPEVGDVHRAPILRAPCRSAQDAASHQNLGYRAGGRTSEVTVTDSGPKEETVTRASLREYAAVQRERYLTATRGEKGALLDEVVAVTGLHRKAAIRLLRRPPRASTARSRAGRPRIYGPAVATAVEVLWQATGHIGPHRLHPFVPDLLDRLTRDGELTLAPEVDKLVRHDSPATLGRLLAPARQTRPPRGASSCPRARRCARPPVDPRRPGPAPSAGGYRDRGPRPGIVSRRRVGDGFGSPDL